MNRRRGFGKRSVRHLLAGQRGIAMVKTVLAMPVLLLLFLGVYDLGVLLFHRAQVRSAATAAALAAVGTQEHYPIPIPTEFIWVGFPIPVDGIIINTVHLPNVDAALRSWTTGAVRGEAAVAATLTDPAIQLRSEVLPTGWVPLPFKWVEVTAEVEPPRGLLTRLTGLGTVNHKACAVAWVRPDYWVHPWWDQRTLEVTEPFLKGSRSGGQAQVKEPLRYYRLVSCGWGGLADLVEVVAEAHFAVTGRRPTVDEMKAVMERKELQPGGEGATRWRKGERSPRPTRDELARCIKEPDACVDLPPSRIRCPGTDVTIDRPDPVRYGRETPPEQRPDWTEADLIRERCPPPDSTDSNAT